MSNVLAAVALGSVVTLVAILVIGAIELKLRVGASAYGLPVLVIGYPVFIGFDAALRIPCARLVALIASRSELAVGGLALMVLGLALIISNWFWQRKAFVILAAILFLVGGLGGVTALMVGVGCPVDATAAVNPDQRPLNELNRSAINLIAMLLLSHAFGIYALGAALVGGFDFEQAFAPLNQHLRQFGGRIDTSGVVASLATVALIVWLTGWGFNKWAARQRWRNLMRGPVVIFACGGLLPALTGVIGTAIASRIGPTHLVAGWSLGIGLGFGLSLWLAFGPWRAVAPSVQTR
jgi:hypothetical protein